MKAVCPCAQYLNTIIIWLFTLPKRHDVSKRPERTLTAGNHIDIATKEIIKKCMFATRMCRKWNYIRNNNTPQTNNDAAEVLFACIQLCPFAKYPCSGIRWSSWYVLRTTALRTSCAMGETQLLVHRFNSKPSYTLNAFTTSPTACANLRAWVRVACMRVV